MLNYNSIIANYRVVNHAKTLIVYKNKNKNK